MKKLIRQVQNWRFSNLRSFQRKYKEWQNDTKTENRHTQLRNELKNAFKNEIKKLDAICETSYSKQLQNELNTFFPCFLDIGQQVMLLKEHRELLNGFKVKETQEYGFTADISNDDLWTGTLERVTEDSVIVKFPNLPEQWDDDENEYVTVVCTLPRDWIKSIDGPTRSQIQAPSQAQQEIVADPLSDLKEQSKPSFLKRIRRRISFGKGKEQLNLASPPDSAKSRSDSPTDSVKSPASDDTERKRNIVRRLMDSINPLKKSQ